MITSSKKRELLVAFCSLVCGMCAVCHSSFALPCCVSDRLYSVIVCLPGHLPRLFSGLSTCVIFSTHCTASHNGLIGDKRFHPG